MTIGNQEIETRMNELNEKYDITNLPRRITYMNTFERAENEIAVALLVEYWHRKEKITPVPSKEFMEMIADDETIYKEVTEEIQNRFNSEPVKDKLFYLVPKIGSKAKNKRMDQIITEVEHEKEKPFNPLLEFPDYQLVARGVLTAYKGDLLKKGYVEFLNTDDGELVVPTESLLERISNYENK